MDALQGHPNHHTSFRWEVVP